MFANLSGWHLIILLAIVLLLFGATRLPALSRSVGQSVRIFKSETKAMRESDAESTTPAAPAASPAESSDALVTHAASQPRV